MSMNIVVRTVNDRAFIEFPYQTSTELTYKVMNEPDKSKQLQLFIDDLKDRYDMRDRYEAEMFWDRISQIGEYIFNDKYQLEII